MDPSHSASEELQLEHDEWKSKSESDELEYPPPMLPRPPIDLNPSVLLPSTRAFSSSPVAVENVDGGLIGTAGAERAGGTEDGRGPAAPFVFGNPPLYIVTITSR
jgi:hypothetical protein